MVNGARQRRADPLGDLDASVAPPRTSTSEDRELVAAEAGGGVAGRTQVMSRSATATSSSSPTAWPRLSLTVLKSSRSMNSTRDAGAVVGARHGVGDPFAEQRAVGQTGQRVVERLVRELVLDALRSLTSRALSTNPSHDALSSSMFVH